MAQVKQRKDKKVVTEAEAEAFARAARQAARPINSPAKKGGA